MATPFDKINLRWVNDVLRKATSAIGKINKMFVGGNHFQEGSAWIGPSPDPEDKAAPRAWYVLSRGFISKNVMAEVSERHTSGVVGREVSWGFSDPTKAKETKEEREKDTARAGFEELLTKWWDKRGVSSTIREAVMTLLSTQRGALRVFIPAGFVEDAEEDDGEGGTRTVTVVRAATIEEALDMIYVEHPDWENATVTEDEDTREPITVYRFQRDRKQYVELTYLEDGQTVIRTLGTRVDEDYTLDLGGRLLMFEMRRPLFLTEQVQQAQKALNVALTNIPKTIVTSGWLERTLLNAQLPGRYVKDAKSGAERFVPSAYQTGPQTTSFVRGITYKDESGRTVLANPSIQYREPIAATASIEARDAHYADILDETDQRHVLLSGEAGTSGRSRVEARVDYLASLHLTQGQVEGMVRWLLETVLALAEAISGKPQQLSAKYRVTARARLFAGTLDAEEQKVILERVEKGLMPKEWAMELMGVDDVDAAIELMRNSPESQLDLLMRRLEALVIATQVLSAQDAAKLIGFTPEQQAIFARARDPVEEPTTETKP